MQYLYTCIFINIHWLWQHSFINFVYGCHHLLKFDWITVWECLAIHCCIFGYFVRNAFWSFFGCWLVSQYEYKLHKWYSTWAIYQSLQNYTQTTWDTHTIKDETQTVSVFLTKYSLFCTESCDMWGPKMAASKYYLFWCLFFWSCLQVFTCVMEDNEREELYSSPTTVFLSHLPSHILVQRGTVAVVD